MLSFRLYLWQRLTALVMAPLVIIHIGVMIYAVNGGLDAAEILGRTRGSWLWGIVYGTFVIAAAVHGSIGLRVISFELFGLEKRWLDFFTLAVGLALLILGGRAVYAVVIG
jgi:fumarate reductase subunit C